MLKILNPGAVRSRVLRERGGDEEEAGEAPQLQGQESARKGAAVIGCASCFVCLATAFLFVWSILGFISFIVAQTGHDQVDGREVEKQDGCRVGLTYYWVIFGVGMAASGCTSTLFRKKE